MATATVSATANPHVAGIPAEMERIPTDRANQEGNASETISAGTTSQDEPCQQTPRSSECATPTRARIPMQWTAKARPTSGAWSDSGSGSATGGDCLLPRMLERAEEACIEWALMPDDKIKRSGPRWDAYQDWCAAEEDILWCMVAARMEVEAPGLHRPTPNGHQAATRRKNPTSAPDAPQARGEDPT
jgi:hypothetical protein